jgi:uncharacterized protein (DUF2141 family)
MEPRHPAGVISTRAALLAPTLLLALAAAPPSISAADYPDTGTLTLELTGFRSDEGQARIVVFNQAEGFPRNAARGFRFATGDIHSGRSQLVIDALPPGTYAVSVIHDEDGDGTLTTNLIGLPTEGVGASRNPKVRMGPPRFEDARFELAASQRMELSIRIRYLF